MYVRENATGCDGDLSEKLVELFIVADGELNVAGHNSSLFVVTGGVAGKLEDLGSEVLHYGSEIHGGASANTGGVPACEGSDEHDRLGTEGQPS